MYYDEKYIESAKSIKTTQPENETMMRPETPEEMGMKECATCGFFEFPEEFANGSATCEECEELAAMAEPPMTKEQRFRKAAMECPPAQFQEFARRALAQGRRNEGRR